MQLAAKFIGTLLWIAAAAFILAASAASAETYPPDTDNLSADVDDDTPSTNATVEVTGTVFDNDGNPIEGAEVTFTITSNPGDAEFSNGSDTITAVTDADGIARVSLSTGADPGSIVVRVESGDKVTQVTVTTDEPQALPPTGGEPSTGDSGLPLLALLGAGAVLAGAGLITLRKSRVAA